MNLFLRLMPICFLLAIGNLYAADKHIDVSIQRVDGAYKLVFLNSECPESPNKKGCILGDRGENHMLRWELDSQSAADWELSGLMFSNDGQNWGDPAHPLQDCTVDDFELTESDRASGVASPARVTANGKRLQIRNGNYNVCIVHYMLFASHKETGQEVDSDPIVDNRGGGRR